jgi:menaquinone-dependent protoporphyrinogen IX oxidase
MRAVVVYESMYGNTHEIAKAVGRRLAAVADVSVVPLDDASPVIVGDADLLVVGGPTHVHGMSRPSTLNAAVKASHSADGPELDPDAPGPGLRAWFDALPEGAGMAAAFDTRLVGPAMVTGRASNGIARRLHRHGYRLLTRPESFLVTKENTLAPGEADHAAQWADELIASAAPVTSPNRHA